MNQGPSLATIKATSILLLGLVLFFCPQPGRAHIWVLIDTDTSVLKIMDHQQAIKTLDDISVGRGGVADLHIKGDDKTPRGEFNIVRINRDSKFQIFFEINYPTTYHADLALDKGIINQNTYTRIKQQQDTAGTAPRDTELGAYLGIHGIGNGDLQVHQTFNWTNGCVALTNEQIELLSKWIKIGTKVVIK